MRKYILLTNLWLPFSAKNYLPHVALGLSLVLAILLCDVNYSLHLSCCMLASVFCSKYMPLCKLSSNKISPTLLLWHWYWYTHMRGESTIIVVTYLAASSANATFALGLWLKSEWAFLYTINYNRKLTQYSPGSSCWYFNLCCRTKSETFFGICERSNFPPFIFITVPVVLHVLAHSKNCNIFCSMQYISS